MTRSRILAALSKPGEGLIGIIGATMMAVGLFLPALHFHVGSVSLWDAHRWTAIVLLGTAGFVLFLCGSGAYRWFIPTAIWAMIVTAVRLLTIMWRINSELSENARLSTNEPGWARLFAMGIPQVHWLGWAVLVLGTILILIAGLTSPRSKFLQPPASKPAS